MVQIWHVPPRPICWVWSLVWQSTKEVCLDETGCWAAYLINRVILLWLPMLTGYGKILATEQVGLKSKEWVLGLSCFQALPPRPASRLGRGCVSHRSSHGKQFTLLFPNMFCLIPRLTNNGAEQPCNEAKISFSSYNFIYLKYFFMAA